MIHKNVLWSTDDEKKKENYRYLLTHTKPQRVLTLSSCYEASKISLNKTTARYPP